MADFDPDAYLAKKSESAGFDPDAYLSAKDSAPSETEKAGVRNKRKYDNAGDAFFRGAAETLSLGYLPQIEGAVDVATNKVAGLLNEKFGLFPNSLAAVSKRMEEQGQDVPLPSYVDARDQAIKEGEMVKKYSPKASLAGNLAGGLLSAPLAIGGAVGAGAGTAQKLAAAAKAGAATGALYNPGDVKGELSPLQLEERGAGAITGAASGLLGQALGQGVSALKDKTAQSLQSYGREKAFKSSGAMLKDFKKAMGKKKLDELGDVMFEEKLFKPGKSFDYVAEKSAEKLDDVGSQIGKIYDKIGIKPIDQRGIYNDVLSEVVKKRPAVGGRQYDQKVQDVLEDLANNEAFKNGDIREFNKFLSGVDDMIDQSKKANELKSVQQGYLAIKNKLRGVINKIAEDSGSPELVKLNKRYSNLSEINRISSDKVARESANRAFGLTDTIAGTGGLGVGLLSGDSPEEKIQNALLYGGLLGGGNKLIRSYGAPLAARAARGAGGLLEQYAPNVPQIFSDPRSQAMTRALLERQKRNAE